MKSVSELVRYFLIIINFGLVYFGVWEHILNLVFQNCDLIKLISTILLLVFSVVLSFPEIVNSIRDFKKSDLNNALSITVLSTIICMILILIFKTLGLEIKETEYDWGTTLIVTSLLCAPIYEELICRLSIISLLSNTNKYFIIILSSLLFSFFHFKNIEISNISSTIMLFLIYFILGISCSIAYVKYKNVIYPILIHFFWNLFIVIGSILRNIFYIIMDCKSLL